MTRAPDGNLLDVPAPLMVRTGVTDADGQEAVVPSVHSDLYIRISSGPNTTMKKLPPRYTLGCSEDASSGIEKIFPQRCLISESDQVSLLVGFSLTTT